ncbi:hypothetical protein ACROSK_004186, partial [Yersinia enterocolitica]
HSWRGRFTLQPVSPCKVEFLGVVSGLMELTNMSSFLLSATIHSTSCYPNDYFVANKANDSATNKQCDTNKTFNIIFAKKVSSRIPKVILSLRNWCRRS